MIRCILFLLPVLLLFGCGQEKAAEPVSAEPVPAEIVTEGITSSLSAYEVGQQTYEQACAGCHAEGLDGAPKVGDRAYWDGRSRQWDAVLFEHARKGFENMPAKGGEVTLDEAAVTKAAEYMMSLTYPEMPRG